MKPDLTGREIWLMPKVSTTLCPSQALLSLQGAWISGCSLDPDWGYIIMNRMLVCDISFNLTAPPLVLRAVEVLEGLQRCLWLGTGLTWPPSWRLAINTGQCWDRDSKAPKRLKCYGHRNGLGERSNYGKSWSLQIQLFNFLGVGGGWCLCGITMGGLSLCIFFLMARVTAQ